MRMQVCSFVRVWGAARRSFSYRTGMVAVAALAASAAGCSSLPSSNGRMSLASAVSPSTVAFESIDGPPPEVFRKLVADLNAEAGTRKIAVVSRESAATYRVRGYVSALVERDKTTFAWVWDVYDADKRRALRISGEEPAAAGKRRDAWAAADEQVLRRMARNGMDQMSGFLNSSELPPAVAPLPNFITLVSGRDDTPEGAGIVRLVGSQDQPTGSATPAAPANVAVPPQPPKTRKRAAAATAARATQSAAETRITDGRSANR
jgi:hypothetical protein